ncbi:MAG: type II toxin-antitoxin system VapC family toxin [Candidatus Jordarchaeum sp.]|uniref:type II toxin-antitoxin system VapC family toxin n=1 Tax=Candidatus Jordarchaeum sp. TaxID=2823881 RepID=UPI004049FB79
MSIFIDSLIFVAFHNTRDKNHDKALKLIKKAVSGEFGTIYTSDYIFDESFTTALNRTNNPSITRSLGEMILGGLKTPNFIIMLRVSSEIFRKSWELFVKYAEKCLSFTLVV